LNSDRVFTLVTAS